MYVISCITVHTCTDVELKLTQRFNKRALLNITHWCLGIRIPHLFCRNLTCATQFHNADVWRLFAAAYIYCRHALIMNEKTFYMSKYSRTPIHS